MKSVFPLTILCLTGCLAMPLRASQPTSADALPDTNPQAQMDAFIVPEGFQVELFASDPMIRKPVQMNWDAEGRLWVVSSTTYPQIKPGAPTVDQVLVLEDTDGDGKADKSTVFAEDLHIPTAVIPGDGGVYVANSTELLFLKDTDGDLKADERKVVLSGFGTEDTHHLLHTLRFGPEGLLYFLQSIYIHSHLETPHGVRRLMGGGVWEFRPETRRAEVLSKGLINPWGFEFDRWGQSFATDGAGSEGVNYVFPQSVFATSPGAARVLRGLSPGQPKHCGLEIVEEPHFPDDWQGNFITCDFRGNRINRFKLERSGSGYIATQLEDVLASHHRAFRPIDVRVGPDGALYIADWYNPIIQHGEVDFRDPRRDQVHGRIWRMTVKDRPLSERPAIAGQPVEAVLELLKSDRRYVRHFAKQELRAQGADVVEEALAAWAAVQTEEHALLEAAWASEGVNAFSPKLWQQVWASEDARIRAGALRILTHRWRGLPKVEETLAMAIGDEDAQVRLWAMAVCGEVGTPETLEIALRALDAPMDEPLDFLLDKLCREQADRWLPEVLSGKVKLNGNPAHQVYALRATGQSRALRPLFAALEAGKLSDEQTAGVLETAGRAMDAEGAAALASLVEAPNLKGREGALLGALVEAARSRKVGPEGAEAWVSRWLGAEDLEVRAQGAELAGLWKVEVARPQLAALLTGSPVERAGAVAGLAALGGEASRDLLDSTFMKESDLAAKAVLLSGLVRVGPMVAAERGVDYLQAAETVEQTRPVMDLILQNKQMPALVAKALTGKKLPEPVAVEAIRMASTRGVQGPLLDALKSAGGVKQMDRPPTAEEMQALVAKVNTEGDAARGEAIYRQQQLLCITCHAIGDAGGLIGPNLVSIGGSAPVDYLIESLLEPSKKIKEGYHMVMVSTKGGQMISGGLVQDGDTELVIRDPANQLISVPKADVTEKQMSPVSMMPAGLTASLREDQFVDLVKFLSQLGREGDYKVGPQRMVRTWRRMGPMTPDQIEHVRHVGLMALHEKDGNYPWLPFFSQVDGSLPVVEMGSPNRISPWFPHIAQFALEMDAEGSVALKLSHHDGVWLVVDEEVLGNPGAEPRLELRPGRHLISVLLSREAGPIEEFSVEILEGAARVVAP